MQLLSNLSNPNQTSLGFGPNILSLASALTHLITRQRTATAINNTITLHGVTRSKELVHMYYKQGFGISYADILYLRDCWALHDLEKTFICPAELGNGVPGVQIVDNDDFRNDTLTGSGTSHRTNVMYVQHTALNTPLGSINIKDANITASLKVYATTI